MRILLHRLLDDPRGVYHRYRSFILAYFAIIIVLTISFILPLVEMSPEIRTIISDIQTSMISLGALAALLLATYRTQQLSPVYTRVWLFLSLAQFFYFLGDFVWFFNEVLLNQSPYPSYSDLFYLLYYPFIFIAILQYPVRNFQSTDWIKRFLDLLSILLGGLPIYWNYILGPIIQANSNLSYFEQALAYAYPLGDLILLGAILLLFYNRVRDENQAPIILVAFGILAMVISDSAFSIETMLKTYVSGGWTDFGYILQNLLVAVAGVWQIMTVRKVSEIKKMNSTLLDMMAGLFSYLPLLWLAGLSAMLFDRHTRPLPMTFEQIYGFTITVWIVVVLRQVVTNVDIKHMLHSIDEYIKTVHRQSEDLEKINAGLEEEMALREEADREKDKIAEQLRFDALHDCLTQLPNRTLFLDRLDQAIARTDRIGISYAVLILDLDEFKHINDTKGHVAGDDLLVHVAERLKKCLRMNDTVARLGGDEFIILMENPGDKDTIIATCNRILDEFKLPFAISGDVDVFISVSIGVVVDAQNYEKSSDVLRDADIAMYYAKEKGKSRYEVFRPELRDSTIKRVIIENELRTAIAQKEFSLQYQPVFSLTTDSLIGFEALIRWNNPRLGRQMPAEFIPIAEESGLIVEIGEWVLQEACRQLKEWHEKFPLLNHLVMNVNISGKQFSRPDFLKNLQTTIETIGLKTRSVKLEITESLLLDNKLRDSNFFNTLRQMGTLLQIDDFGTGYSSLSYLQHIPVDVIKIDRSFIKDLGDGNKSSDLIRAIVRMAHSLNMETTAEGIETWEQKAILTGMDCDYGQGFLLSKPMDVKMIEEYLEGEQNDMEEISS